MRAVPVHIETDSEAALHFAARLDRFLPAARRHAWERAHVALGLLPPDTDVQRLLLDILAEQAGGYYDPDRAVFVLLGDMPEAALGVLVAHELTHALDDQHFDIDARLEHILDDDDDAEAAFGAVVEGAGMQVMTAWTTRELDAGRLRLEDLAALAETEAARARELAAAPDVLVRGLLAPYLAGQEFLQRGGGGDSIAAAIDRAFRDPPRSTEQILHPAKYWDPDSLDLPGPIPPFDVAASLGGGFVLAGSGTLGEVGLSSLTGAPLDAAAAASGGGAEFTNAAAAGWDGDRWLLYERGDAAVTILVCRFDTPRDAIEFETRAHWPRAAVVERRAAAVVAVCGAPHGRAARAVAGAAFAALAAAPTR